MEQIFESSPLLITVRFSDEDSAELMNTAAQHNIVIAGGFADYLGEGMRLGFSQEVKNAGTGIALINFDGDIDRALTTAHVLQKLGSPRIHCVAVSASKDADLVVSAMRAGCCEFLPLPIQSDALCEAISRIEARHTSPAMTTGRNGMIYSCIAVRGGSGATTIAVQLALALAKIPGKRTLLVDYAEQLGHAALYLNAKQNAYSVTDLFKALKLNRLDAQLLEGFLTPHSDSLYVLNGPESFMVRPSHQESDAQKVFQLLRAEFDYVIFDASVRASDIRLLVTQSDGLFFVATPDVGSIRDLRRISEVLLPREELRSKSQVILNHFADTGVEVEHISTGCNLPVLLAIEDMHHNVTRAMNAGHDLPPSLRSLASGIMRLREHIAPDYVDPESQRKRGFSFLKKGNR